MITLPKDLIEDLLKYLWSRPMNEAYDLFNRLSSAVREQADPPQSQQPQKQPTGGLLHRDQLLNQ